MRTIAARLVFITSLVAAPAWAQMSGNVDLRTEEATIRSLATSRPTGIAASDAIFWSGAYARPIIGHPAEPAKALPRAQMQERRNSHIAFTPVRIDVASSGDMAYDYSTFELSFDLASTGKHVATTGAALTVWKKIDGQWRIEATFMRPYDDPAP